MNNMDIGMVRDFLKDLAKFKQDVNDYCISAIWLTGQFSLFDYGAGLLNVSFYAKRENLYYQGVISISTIDDGVWQAYHEDVNFFTKEKCREIADDMYETFKGILPTEEKLNEFLSKYKVFGVHTG